jgi:hypothetical protein
VVSEAFAQQIFPIIDSSDEAYRASIVTATLETEGIPTGDRLARFALSLAKLACGDTLSSSDY